MTNDQKILSILKPATTIAEVESLCSKAKEQRVTTICIPPLFIKKAKEFVGEVNIKIATVIGFPFGYSAVEAKLAEIVLAILDGVDELDVVINLAALKNNDWQYLAHELNSILPIIKSKNKAIKIIIEAGELTDDEIMKCCDLYGIAGVDFIVSATGYSTHDVTVERIELIRKHLADAVKIIAAGNSINDKFADDLLAAGAALIQTNEGQT